MTHHEGFAVECPSCGFNNIPGTTRCARCRAVLVAADAVAPDDLAPPRASRLKWLRRLRHAINRVKDHLPRNTLKKVGRLFTGNATLPGESIAGVLFSVVPGLGHFVSGRRRAALIAVGAWLVLAFVTVNYYTGATGGVLLGLVMAWHAGVMFDAGRLQQHARDVGARLRLMAVLLLVSLVGYLLLDRAARRFFGFVRCPLTIPTLDVQSGDTLLVRWRRRFAPGDVEPGNLLYHDGGERIVIRLPGGREGRMITIAGGERRIGRVMALGGARVEVSPRGLSIDGRAVNADELPSGNYAWPKEPLEFAVPRNRVLIPLPLERGTRRAALIEDAIGQLWTRTFVVPVANLRARAVAVYLPLGRRHRLRDTALAAGEPGSE